MVYSVLDSACGYSVRRAASSGGASQPPCTGGQLVHSATQSAGSHSRKAGRQACAARQVAGRRIAKPSRGYGSAIYVAPRGALTRTEGQLAAGASHANSAWLRSGRAGCWAGAGQERCAAQRANRQQVGFGKRNGWHTGRACSGGSGGKERCVVWEVSRQRVRRRWRQAPSRWRPTWSSQA